MKTCHRILAGDAGHLAAVPDESVDLVVTSPPYPMIEMWDGIFSAQDASIALALDSEDGWTAFRRMHDVLDRVWRELSRVLVSGGIACINIGDATRTIREEFALYPNHARILSSFVELGFTPLPAILWRKQTNAPNKFMGSGMMPPGAYVTLEHEYVLVLRKGDKRGFPSEAAKSNRRRSAFFWEERNHWFSDVWFDLKGTEQDLGRKDLRERSGAFPFELPYRLIHMFSVQGDTVLDPFAGTGTTLFAAMAAARNSAGVEIDPALVPLIRSGFEAVPRIARERAEARLTAHREFVAKRFEEKGSFGYRNACYGFPVVTRQEIDLALPVLRSVDRKNEGEIFAEYAGEAPRDESDEWAWFFSAERAKTRKPVSRRSRRVDTDLVQRDLFDLDRQA